jgi:uncharacterized protein YndB with AHSA1/START domain
VRNRRAPAAPRIAGARRQGSTEEGEMRRLEESVVIERPIEEVFLVAGDPENDPRWAPTVTEVRKTSDGPLGLGTTYEHVIRLLGRRIEISFEVTDYEPNRALEIGRFSGPFRGAVGRRTLEPVERGTRVTFAAQGTSGLFFNLLEPLVVAAIRRQFTRSVVRLKHVLEAGTAPPR